MAVQAGEGHYFNVLRKQARFLGDYEEVHFRKSSVAPHASRPATTISIAPRRPSRFQVVHFSKATAALFLKQTESLWMNLDLTRSEATELLLDRPVGSFMVRGSQRAKHALSLRTAMTDDTVVKHFLIQVNQQNFLTIQGSNLPFVSIYDLLAYFCFHQSGGMPCCLKPPNPDHVGREGIKTEGTDSSESESDPEDGEAVVPPVPPRTASMVDIQHATRGAESRQQSTRGAESPVASPRPRLGAVTHTGEVAKKKVPPPKPPRPTEGWGSEEGEELASVNRRGGGDREELERRVGVATGAVAVSHTTNRHQPPIRPRPYVSASESPPKTSYKSPLQRKRSKSSDFMVERHRNYSNAAASAGNSPTGGRHKVSSLIEMFESKSPDSSPKRTRVRGKAASANAERAGAGVPRQWGASYSQDNAPTPPPKPKIVIPPVPPRPLSTECGEEGVPIVPPRTPAPLLPPKPPGSLPPTISPRNKQHRRSLSDSRSESGQFVMIGEEEVPPKIPPKVKPRFPPGYETMPSSRLNPNYDAFTSDSTTPQDIPAEIQTTAQQDEDEWVELGRPREVTSGVEESGLNGDNMMIAEVDIIAKGSWQIVANTTTHEGGEGGSTGGKRKRSKRKLGWAKKKLHFRPGKGKPRKRLRKYILELSNDQNNEFGQRITEFVTEMRARNTEAHQKMLLEIRNFITAMHEYLLQHHLNDLNNCGMDVCENASHVVECTLQERILQPLSHFVYLRIEEFYATNGHLFQVQRSIHQGKLKSTEEMGIRPHLIVPSEKAITEMMNLFSQMMKTSCAISKLEYLLEVVRLTYENVRDSRQPKKTMNDLGADDFLPIFVWVLVQCAFTRAEIEAEYMWGLAHPSLFNGEGGYYLTTLTSAINVLKELTNTPQHTAQQQQQLPTMNNLQTELKVYFEDEHTGQYSSAYYLPIVPTMTAAEICEIIVERRQISDADSYGLFTVEDGKATVLKDDERPQEIKLKWTLQRSGGKNPTPSSQFFAYKLRTHSRRTPSQ